MAVLVPVTGEADTIVRRCPVAFVGPPGRGSTVRYRTGMALTARQHCQWYWQLVEAKGMVTGAPATGTVPYGIASRTSDSEFLTLKNASCFTLP